MQTFASIIPGLQLWHACFHGGERSQAQASTATFTGRVRRLAAPLSLTLHLARHAAREV